MKHLFFVAAMSTLMIASAFGGELLVNGGFESGLLDPWYNARDYCFTGVCVSWYVSAVNPHSGTYSATNVDNIELRQNIQPTLGSNIANVSFWVNSTFGFNAVDFFYSDGTVDERGVFSSPDIWTYENVTGFVRKNKILTGLSIFGVSRGVSYFDDASITLTPEPGSLLLLGGGICALARRLSCGARKTS